MLNQLHDSSVTLPGNRHRFLNMVTDHEKAASPLAMFHNSFVPVLLRAILTAERHLRCSALFTSILDEARRDWACCSCSSIVALLPKNSKPIPSLTGYRCRCKQKGLPLYRPIRSAARHMTVGKHHIQQRDNETFVFNNSSRVIEKSENHVPTRTFKAY
jgi:hypothetical protein